MQRIQKNDLIWIEKYNPGFPHHKNQGLLIYMKFSHPYNLQISKTYGFRI